MDEFSFTEILEPGNVTVDLVAESRDEALAQAVDLISRAAPHREEILRSILEREAIQTTGIGYGIAIPHGKAMIDVPILGSVAITRGPLAYGSVDGTPVRIILLMVSRPDVTGPHVRALAHVARLLGRRRAREALLACTTPEEVLAILRGEVP